jgi:hypothetical protein
MSREKRRETFDLQPLLYPALPVDSSINPASPAALNRSLRCAEPYKSNLYLGASDGQIYCFVQPPDDEVNGSSSSSSSSTSSNELRHVGTRSISSKAIDKILVLSKLGIAAVLSEATLTFHELPSFLPIPPQVLPHSKGVASIVLDDEEVNQSWTADGGLDAEGLCNLCVIRRKTITLVKVGIDTWRVIKEIPLPKGATVARRSGNSLCIATTTEYNMVDLEAATMSNIGLPITQTGDTPSAANRPSILSIASRKPGVCEFLITSHSQSSTLGVFVSQEGDPTAKLLEWPSHPRALALEYPFLHALLRNDTIEVHNVLTMEKIQTLHLPPLLEPRLLSLATSRLELAESRKAQMSLLTVRLEKGGKRRRANGTTTSWKQTVLEKRKTRSRVLLIGKNAVQCLCTTRFLDTAKKAIERGDYERARSLVDQAWEQRNPDSDKADETAEFEYLNQMIAVHCLRMLQFEEAHTYLIRGRLDPQIVLHLFPTMFAGLSDAEPVVEMFADVDQGLSELGDLDSYPISNLQLNYTPPLKVDGEEILQRLLGKMTIRIHSLARKLIDDYRLDESTKRDDALVRMLDTCLAKVMIAEGKQLELADFLAGSNSCDIDILEPYLSDMGCHAALLQIRQARSDWQGAFELLTRLLDGEVQDHTFKGSLQDVVELLERCPEANLVHQYSLWLIQRDSEAGIKVLTKDKSFGDQRSMVEQVRAIDERAADALLENTALSKKQHTAEAHMELVQLLVSRLKKAFESQEERLLMEQVTQDYIQGQYAESFVAHMALRLDQTQTIVKRLKLIMLLQASAVLDVPKALEWVQEEPLLVFERAILLGRQRKDIDALEVLAIHLRDANSAEIYCNQNRSALSSVQLQSLAVEQKELVLYANFYAKSLKKTSRDNKVKLLKVLLQVYMERGVNHGFQVATSHLLNTQSLNLSPLEVLHLVPADWSLSTLETFLSRSLRKEMHKSNEGQIQRNIALAQNLEVTEMLWAKRRGLGGVIEDGSPGELEGEADDDIDDVEQVIVEKERIKEEPDVFEVRDDGL